VGVRFRMRLMFFKLFGWNWSDELDKDISNIFSSFYKIIVVKVRNNCLSIVDDLFMVLNSIGNQSLSKL
jgi:hypothetical protein